MEAVPISGKRRGLEANTSDYFLCEVLMATYVVIVGVLFGLL